MTSLMIASIAWPGLPKRYTLLRRDFFRPAFVFLFFFRFVSLRKQLSFSCLYLFITYLLTLPPLNCMQLTSL